MCKCLLTEKSWRLRLRRLPRPLQRRPWRRAMRPRPTAPSAAALMIRCPWRLRDKRPLSSPLPPAVSQRSPSPLKSKSPLTNAPPLSKAPLLPKASNSPTSKSVNAMWTSSRNVPNRLLSKNEMPMRK